MRKLEKCLIISHFELTDGSRGKWRIFFLSKSDGLCDAHPENLSKTDVWILLGCAEGVSERNRLIYKAHLKHEMSTYGDIGDQSSRACQISPVSSYQKENIFSQEIYLYIYKIGLINSNEVSKYSVSKFPLTEMRLHSCSLLYSGFSG